MHNKMNQEVRDFLEGIRNDIAGLKSDVELLRTDVTGMKSDIELLRTDVTSMKSDIEFLKTDNQLLRTDIAGLRSDVEILRTDVTGLKSDVEILRTDITGLRTDVELLRTDITGLRTDAELLRTDFGRLATDVTRIDLRYTNSTLGRDDALQRVPLPDGTLPLGEYPVSLAALLVAGNESLPNGQLNTWNAKKSRDLLIQYDPNYETDGEVEELSTRSRNRRLRLARVLGVTRAQLNFAQLSL